MTSLHCHTHRHGSHSNSELRVSRSGEKRRLVLLHDADLLPGGRSHLSVVGNGTWRRRLKKATKFEIETKKIQFRFIASPESSLHGPVRSERPRGTFLWERRRELPSFGRRLAELPPNKAADFPLVGTVVVVGRRAVGSGTVVELGRAAGAAGLDRVAVSRT